MLLRKGLKLILGRYRSQPIKYRVRERQPITERLLSIDMKSRLEMCFIVQEVMRLGKIMKMRLF